VITLTFPSDLRIARQGNFVTTDWDKYLVSLGQFFTQISVRDSSTEGGAFRFSSFVQDGFRRVLGPGDYLIRMSNVRSYTLSINFWESRLPQQFI